MFRTDDDTKREEGYDSLEEENVQNKLVGGSDEENNQDENGQGDQDDYKPIEDGDNEKDKDEEEEDDKFDHLIPPNWREIADMRLRQLDKEYDQCLKYEKKQDDSRPPMTQKGKYKFNIDF